MAKRVTFCVSCQLKKQDLDIICTIKGADSHSKDAMQHIEGAEMHIKGAEQHMKSAEMHMKNRKVQKCT